MEQKYLYNSKNKVIDQNNRFIIGLNLERITLNIHSCNLIKYYLESKDNLHFKI